MSPIATVCHRHQALVAAGELCPECEQDERRRRALNNQALGRNSAHWRRLSARARRLAHGICGSCGGRERADDDGSKLTVDLIRGTDHARARISDVAVACRRCHGTKDGGRARRVA
jgi:hypothetical protein